MNRTASAKKIATIHLARMERRAMIGDNLKEVVTKAILEKESSEIRAKMKGSTAKGLMLLAKENEASFMDFMEKPDVDLSDPIQRLFHICLSKAESREEARDMIGAFTLSFKKRDIDGMAKALRVSNEVITVVLLWYVRDRQTNLKLATSREYLSRADSVERGFEATLNFSKSTLSLINTVIKGGVSFLTGFLPERVQHKVQAPLSLATLGVILYNSWPLMVNLSGVLASLFSAGLSVLASYSSLSASLVTIGLTGGAIFLLIEACVWFGNEKKKLKEWGSGNLFEVARLSFKIVWEIVKLIFKGVYSVASWFYDEISSYARLLQEDASNPEYLAQDLEQSQPNKPKDDIDDIDALMEAYI